MAEEWPRQELPDAALTRPGAGPAIQREVRGARAGWAGGGRAGAAAGLGAGGAGPLRPLPGAGRHCTRRRPSSRGPTGRRAPQPPNRAASSRPLLQSVVSALLRGNRSYFCTENRGAPGSPLP